MIEDAHDSHWINGVCFAPRGTAPRARAGDGDGLAGDEARARGGGGGGAARAGKLLLSAGSDGTVRAPRARGDALGGPARARARWRPPEPSS